MCDADIADIERDHGSRERVLLAVIPSIVDDVLRQEKRTGVKG